MLVLSISVAVLLVGVTAMVGLSIRRRRTSRSRSKRPIPAHILAIRTETSLGQHSRPFMAELGVWRPPPRQELLERQRTARLAAAEQTGDQPAEQGRRRILGDPRLRHRSSHLLEIAEVRRSEPSGPQSIDSLPIATPDLELPASSIRRKRRGLESLITELPSVIEKDRHDPSTP